MNLTIPYGIISILILFSSYAPAKEQSIIVTNAGRINYVGEVVNAPCVVSIDSKNQRILMGQIRTNQFSGSGSWAGSRSFSIKLEDCDENLTKEVSFLFQGVTDEYDPQVFRINSNSGSSASGIGLGLFDVNGNLIVPNSSPQYFNNIITGENEILFMAKYRKTKQNIHTGSANTIVFFSMYYQ